jgi:hypothetical protein
MTIFSLAASDELASNQAAMVTAMPRNLGTSAALEVACKPKPTRQIYCW